MSILSTLLPEVIDLLSPPPHIKVKIETPLPTVSGGEDPDRAGIPQPAEQRGEVQRQAGGTGADRWLR